MSELINLDANASYGVSLKVLHEAQEKCVGALNPSSVHRGGQRARALIEEARDSLRALLRAPSNVRVVFTSGATEANNTALAVPFSNHPPSGSKANIVTSQIEHPSVIESLKRLERQGLEVRWVAPPPNAPLAPESVFPYVDSSTLLVSLMIANNETGEIFPIAEIASLLKSHHRDLLFHSDAVQALAKLPLSWSELGVDMLSLSGHKVGALPGVGALLLNERVPAVPFLLGGPQEMHWRAGTENLLGIVSFGIAAQELMREEGRFRDAMRVARDFIAREITQEIPDAIFHIYGRPSLPNTLSVRFPGVRADDLVVALDLRGVLISSGAACASGKPEPSHVLLAMGIPPDEARETVRISVRADLGTSAAAAASHEIIAAVRAARGRAAT